MKVKLISISGLLLTAGLAFGANETLSLTSGGTNSITLSSGTASFQLDVSSSWTGYSSIGLSYWLQVPTSVAGDFSLTDITYGSAFPDPNQSGPTTVPFDDSTAADGAKSGYSIETRDLGGTETTVTSGSGVPAGTYSETSMTVNVSGLSPGTYVLATTTGSRPSEQSDSSFVAHNFPEADFTITVVPEPDALSLLGLGVFGLFGLTLLRARHKN